MGTTATNNNGEYARLSVQELLDLVSGQMHDGAKDAMDTALVQLETAHKLEPNDEALEFAMVSLKTMQEKFNAHSGKEERLLFPLFKNGRSRNEALKNGVENFVAELLQEHDWLRTRLDWISRATRKYQCEPTATPSHKLAYAHLNDLEQDFNRLFFVEEEYLFPRLIRLQPNTKGT